MSGNKPSVIVVSGPTATGKSSFAISIAKNIGGEIINADSVQVYRDFNIGAAKPSEDQFNTVPHHLFSYVDPDEAYDAGRFAKDASIKIKQITESGKIPIIVGGTGLYIRALLCGLVDDCAPDAEIVSDVEAKEKQLLKNYDDQDASKHFHNWLKDLDPLTAEKFHANDRARVRRAIIYFLTTGKSLAENQQQHKHQDYKFNALVFYVSKERSLLYQSINQRVEAMVVEGLVDEVNSLLQRYPASVRAFGAIGYKHIKNMLSGLHTREEAIDLIMRDTRRFAKRQFTWWNNQPKELGWNYLKEYKGVLDRPEFIDEICKNTLQFLDEPSKFTQNTVALSVVKALD